MDKDLENRIVWAFFAIFIAVIVISLLWGCKTKKVAETVVEYVHDTVQVHKSDTVREVKITHHTDTVKQIETHTYTLNNIGDTVKEIHHYHDLWHTLVVDSTNRYEARMDSLERALKVEKNKNKTVIKRYYIPWWLIATLAIIFIGLYIYVLTYYRKKYSNN